MADLSTESRSPAARELDALPAAEIARRLAEGQSAAAGAVAKALPALCVAAEAMAEAVSGGNRLIYAAAGSSGLMAAADALELPGTFGISADQIVIRMAGGMPQGSAMPGDVEDDAEAGARVGAEARPGDAVLVVSASGRTPYTLAAARAAAEAGAVIIAIANNEAAPLLAAARHPIYLPTPPELLAGSTRMGAGTAQKIALNILSTLMAVRLGHIHEGLMVNLVADNAKLRRRAAGIVAAIAGVSEESAEAALTEANGRVKPAALIAAGAKGAAAAQNLLEASKGQLRAALARL